MRGPTRLVSILVFVGLAGAGCVQAQTEKTISGQYGPTPYISHAEFQDITMEGGAASGKSLSSQPTFRDILTVVSLDEIVSYLGEPESIDRNVFADGERFIATLEYGGMTLKYAKRKDGNVKLTTVEMRSPDWAIEVGGTELRPGMRIDRLSPAVQQSINGDTFLGEDDVDGVGVIRVAEKGKAKEGNVKLIEGKQPQVSVHVNKDTETIKVVRFHRIV